MISACCVGDFDNLPTNRLVEKKRRLRFVEEPQPTFQTNSNPTGPETTHNDEHNTTTKQRNNNRTT